MAVQAGIILILLTKVDGQVYSILIRTLRGFRICSQFFNTAEMDSSFYEKFYSQMTKGTFIGMSRATPENCLINREFIKLAMITASDASFVPAGEGKSLHVLTETVTIKIPSERVNGAYSVTEIVTPPGGGAPPHIHRRENEMFYILEGEFEFRCGDRMFNAAKGAIVALPKEIPHAYKNTGNVLGKTLLVLIPGGTEKAFEEISILPSGPPDLEKINTITMKYGVEFLQP
jgi:mannose-6-phosphate isomerase-like protein (cupin superfamily)